MAVTHRTLRLADQLRVVIGNEVDWTIRQLVQAWARAWLTIDGEWTKAVQDLVDMTEDGRWPSQRAVLRASSVQKALESATREVADLAEFTGITVVTSARQVSTEVAFWQRQIITSQLPVGWKQGEQLPEKLTDQVLAAIVERTTGQIESRKRPLVDDTVEAMKRALVRGVAVGESPRMTAYRMVRTSRSHFNGGLTRAMTIARTETLDAYRSGAAAYQAEHDDVLQGWAWSAKLDARTCPACWGMAGTVHPLYELGPLGHHNCVLPGAVVSGPRALASTARRYDGEVIDIETRSGRVLSVTPNHPILTPHGWVPAGLLSEGDDVVASAGTDRPPVGRGPDDHQVPALIEDVAQTLGRALPVHAVRVPTAAEDFHGDGAGSQVHVVRTDRLLSDHRETSTSQAAGQLQLVVRDVGLPTLAGRGDSALPLEGDRYATGGGLSRQHDGPVLLGGAGRGEQAIRLRRAAQGHTCVLESPVDRGTRDAIRLGEHFTRLSGRVSAHDLIGGQTALREEGRAGPRGTGHVDLGASAPETALDEDGLESPLAYPMPSSDSLTAFAGDIVTDRVLHIRRRRWSGHVYNLQTATGWYLANGIVTHNCRCTRTPLTRPWRDLGIDLDEPESVMPDAETEFRRLTYGEQLRVMGPVRLKAWSSGVLSWSDLAVKRENPGWRDSIAPISIGDARRKLLQPAR